jgi:hypothetical protein
MGLGTEKGPGVQRERGKRKIKGVLLRVPDYRVAAGIGSWDRGMCVIYRAPGAAAGKGGEVGIMWMRDVCDGLYR